VEELLYSATKFTVHTVNYAKMKEIHIAEPLTPELRILFRLRLLLES
jgi:hypothetical protein